MSLVSPSVTDYSHLSDHYRSGSLVRISQTAIYQLLYEDNQNKLYQSVEDINRLPAYCQYPLYISSSDISHNISALVTLVTIYQCNQLPAEDDPF